MQSIITYCVPDLRVWRIEWGLRALALGISRLDLATQYFVLTRLGFDKRWFGMVDVSSAIEAGCRETIETAGS
ncbi:hypothetical protein B7L70_04790 [Vulcanisaeta sp. EB80]|nr:hypothetical protein B7L70_04790 [Vulcanisaeta sp. EB80]